VPVSADLQGWLKTVIGVPEQKNTLVPNGVDTAMFSPAAVTGRHFPPYCFVIGTVGRVQEVKNHRGLVEAFIRLREKLPAERDRLRLAIIGDGACLPALRQQVADAGLTELVWLPGARNDIRDLMRTFSVFALSSIAEGTPVTILEAMATGLPIVATRVGGIPEVVQHGRTGMLAPAADTEALAEALAFYVEHPTRLAEDGKAARRMAEARFSIDATVAAYLNLYDGHSRLNHKLSEPV
jgi:sugar transferase (PEP-CTERM/EpsH1 system associated)